jgi:hypothetical protein
MADLEKLLSEYIAEHRAGGAADPIEYLDQLQGTDREELAVLIDAYLARSPGRSWDQAAFSGSASERLTESLTRSFEGASGLWPTILPRLRDRAQIKRGELVHRLADALGFADREEKVEGYYHEMEQGLLPSAGVSSKVLDALGGIVGASADFLRQAGQPLGTGHGPGDEDVVYARLTYADERYEAPDADEVDGMRSLAEPGGEWDEVDELFRGGG